MRRLLLLVATGALALGGGPFPLPLAQASSVIQVIEVDPSTGPWIKNMPLVSSTHHVKAGEVVFRIKNISKKQDHEMLVIKPPANLKAMPFDVTCKCLVESKLDKRADSGTQKPGESYVMTAELEPGEYTLLCNKPGHYRAGMWTWLTVTR